MGKNQGLHWAEGRPSLVSERTKQQARFYTAIGSALMLGLSISHFKSPNWQLIEENLSAGLPGWQASSRIDLPKCTIDLERRHSWDGNNAVAVNNLLGLSGNRVGEAAFYHAACNTDANQKVLDEGEIMGGLLVNVSSQTGIEYSRCAIYGVSRQLDKHLPAAWAPMEVACVEPTSFAQA